MAGFGFDTSEVEVSSNDFEVMPEGEYTLKAVEAELKDTKKGDGKYLAVKFEVVKGQYVGRKVWQNFNIHNPSEKAEKIGREQVAGWARAAGKPNANDSDQLLERSFQCKLIIEKQSGYSDSNRIGSFLTSDSKPSTPAPTKSSSKFEDEPAKEEPKKEAPAKKEEPKQEDTPKKANPWD